jgi:hypothetical protein
MKTAPGASSQFLDDLMLQLGRRLPSDYLTFMLVTNGAEGKVGSSYVIIWPVEEVLQLNKSYGVSEFAPNLVLFGSDGGTKGYGFDTGSPDFEIVGVDLILTDVTERMGSSLLEFFERLALGD